MRKLFEHYKPERHYMRGPGPKWLRAHEVAGRTDELADERDSGAARLLAAVVRTLGGCRPRRWTRRARGGE